MKRALKVASGLALFAASSLVIAHWFAVLPIQNPQPVVGPVQSQPVSTQTRWYCVRSGGQTDDGPWTTSAAGEAPCGTRVAADGTTRYLEERVTQTSSTTQITSTRRFEVTGSTQLRVPDAQAQMLIVNGANGSGPPPSQGAGFTAQSGYTVEVLSGGGFVDGAEIRITKSGGGFGTKPHAATPLLWVPFEEDANGSSLGRLSGFAGTSQMTYSASGGADGNGRFVGDTATGQAGVSNNWAAYIDSDDWGSSTYDWNSLGQATYVFRRTLKNFGHLDQGPHNVKNIRLWGLSGGGSLQSPNMYFAPSNGRADISGAGGNFYNDLTLANRSTHNGITDEWFTEEFVIKGNSEQDQSAGNGDADFRWYVNAGAPLFYFPWDGPPESYDISINNSDASNDGRMRRLYAIHYVVEGSDGWTPASNGSIYYQDDVYVDDSLCQIFRGDASSLDSMTERELIIPSAWSDTVIDGYLHGNDIAAISGQSLVIRSADETEHYVGDFD